MCPTAFGAVTGQELVVKCFYLPCFQVRIWQAAPKWHCTPPGVLGKRALVAPVWRSGPSGKYKKAWLPGSAGST